jgi:hypothetical protein
MARARCDSGMTIKIIYCFNVIWLALFIACSSTASSPANNVDNLDVHCTEPANPYTEGTGHYAGYEWAEKNGSPTCSGSSQSFIEGCEEFETQESEFADCEARQHN